MILSKRGNLLLEAARRNLELIREHEKESTAEVNFIVEAIASHIRSWKPFALSPIPTETK